MSRLPEYTKMTAEEYIRDYASVLDPVTGCWTWKLAKSKNGYSSMNGMYGHRYSYSVFKGGIPTGLDIDHTCRNRLCVNPEHLEAVTRQTNLRRGKGTKVDDEMASEICRVYAEGKHSTRSLAALFPVTKSQIALILRGRRR